MSSGRIKGSLRGEVSSLLLPKGRYAVKRLLSLNAGIGRLCLCLCSPYYLRDFVTEDSRRLLDGEATCCQYCTSCDQAQLTELPSRP